MPEYKYQCKACDAIQIHWQSITANKKRKCKACGKSKLERVIGTPHIIFKGPGFYENDYKKSS